MTSKGLEKTSAKPRKTSTKNPVAPPPYPVDPPSYHEIAKLAQRYWIDRGRPEGTPEEDWLRAERDLRGRAS
jgi:hypothetical protein